MPYEYCRLDRQVGRWLAGIDDSDDDLEYNTGTALAGLGTSIHGRGRCPASRRTTIIFLLFMGFFHGFRIGPYGNIDRSGMGLEHGNLAVF
jgi:hypothetical protein